MGATSNTLRLFGRAAFVLAVGLGCLLAVMSLVDLLALSQPPTNPEAPTTSEALWLLAWGFIMIVAPLLIRFGLRRRQQFRLRR
jgi:hypothetical protein